jgi:RNA polymerase sigma-70 factor (ECF subfamily)
MSPKPGPTFFKFYWLPLYAYVRRLGYNIHDAENLTQGFFHKLISQDSLSSADPARGRLRAFLLSMLKNHLATE